MSAANIEEALLSAVAVAGTVVVSDFTLALWKHTGPGVGDVLPGAWLTPFEQKPEDTVSIRSKVRQ